MHNHIINAEGVNARFSLPVVYTNAKGSGVIVLGTWE